MKPRILLTTIASLLLVPSALLASDHAAIKAPLTATGDADASGLAIASLSSRRSELVIQARNLTPSHSFAVEVGGVVEGNVVTDRNGKLNVRFRNPAQRGGL